MCKNIITNPKLIKFSSVFNFVTMYKLIKIVVFLMLIFNLQLSAQQSLKGRFGFGIGYNSGIEFSKFNSFNIHFLQSGEKGLSNNFMISGLNTYIYFLILPDTRLSFTYLSGENSYKSTYDPSLYFDYQQSIWGFSLEYTFSLESLNISPGFMIGKVEDNFEIKRYNGVISFDDIVQRFNSNTFNSYSIGFESSSFQISPIISVEYSLSRFLSVRLNYIYLIRLNEAWHFLKKFEIKNVPEDFVSNSSLLTLGINIGFMSK